MSPFVPSWYGLIVGIAGVVGYQVFLIRAEGEGWRERQLAPIVLITILCGLIGARAWHVMTDWQLYTQDFLGVFAIWRGGLSIFGAILGGTLGLAASVRQRQQLLQLLDLSIFGLPLAQAIGRWGNYFNQELYGWPTSLPWGIAIQSSYRLPGLENFTHFHPLFLYESIALLLVAAFTWYKNPPVGSGKVFITYIAWYAWWRVGLDFFRASSPASASIIFTLNQLIMIAVGTVALGWLWYDARSKTQT